MLLAGTVSFGMSWAKADITSGLLTHINFDTASSYSDGLFPDSSGGGLSADCSEALVLGGETHNQCPTQMAGPNGNSAGRFRGTLCDMSSDYLAIPKASALDNLTRGTLALWVKYETTTPAYKSNKLLDSFGTAEPRTWMLGRDGTTWNVFKANNSSGKEIDLLSFPDSRAYEPENDVLFAGWNHLAVTWDGTMVRGYYNGTFFGQASMVDFGSFNLSHYIAIGAHVHGSARNTTEANCVNQYGADPSKTYVWPNNGFHNGGIDDVRIYNRTLSAEDVAQLAAMTTAPSTAKVLIVSKTGDGLGFVGSNPARLQCGTHCAESFSAGQSVTLSATPAANSVFNGWSGACSGTNSTCTVSMNEAKNVTASFARVSTSVATFEAETGTIASPFLVSNDGYIYQPIQIVNPATSGRAAYTFNAPSAGDYIILMNVNAPHSGADSVYVNIDSEPTGDSMHWDMPSTVGFEKHIVTWPGVTPKKFSLSAGAHTLIVRGREGNALIDSIAIEKMSEGSAPAGTWYVRKGATGANNGTSWTNAWNELDQVQWASVKPGHTVFISGGPSGLAYTTALIPSVSGTASQPISIRTSQEVGHNGLVSVGHISIRGDWITLDGSRSSPPSQFFVQDLKRYVALPSESSDGNINLVVTNSSGFGIGISENEGIKVRWVAVRGCGSANPANKANHGFRIYADGKGPLVGMEIAFCSILENGSDGINMLSAGAAGAVSIHHCVIERSADDGIQLQSGTDVSYCLIGGRHPTTAQGHPDLIQTTGGGVIRIYNNILVGEVLTGQFLNSLIYFESRPGSLPNWFIYGNVGYIATSLLPSYAFSFGVQWIEGDPTSGKYEKLVLAHNTIARAPTQAISLWNFWRETVKVNPMVIERAYVVNNIMWDSTLGSGPENGLAFGVGGTSGGMQYTRETFKVEYNVMGGHTDDVGYGYGAGRWESPQEFNAETGFAGNTNAVPGFVDKTNFDFRLNGGDSVARNKGAALSAYLPSDVRSMMPDYDRDLYGNYRGAEGGWDMGAFEFGSAAGPVNDPRTPAGPSDPGGGSTTPTTKFFAFKNVFNPKVENLSIEFSAIASPTVTIYDRGGSLVKTLLPLSISAGVYEALWDGRNLSNEKVASGVYLVVVETNGTVIKKKVVVVK